MGDQVAASEYYRVNNVNAEQQNDVIGLYNSIDQPKVKKRSSLILTNRAIQASAVLRATTTADKTYKTQRA